MREFAAADDYDKKAKKAKKRSTNRKNLYSKLDELGGCVRFFNKDAASFYFYLFLYCLA